MKKRILAMFLTVCFTFGVIGCGGEKTNQVSDGAGTAEVEAEDEEEENMESSEPEDGGDAADALQESEVPEEASEPEKMSQEEELQNIQEAYRETDMEASQNFEAVETTDPVVLKGNGVSVTISLPMEVEEYKKFSQYKIDNVRLVNKGVGPRFILDTSGNSEAYFADGQYFYIDKVENNEERTNGRISDIYTLDTDNGQISVLNFESEELDILGKTCGYIGYYAVLPLENGVILKLQVVENYKLEEGSPYTDDAIIAMFNHCTIGSYEP